MGRKMDRVRRLFHSSRRDILLQLEAKQDALLHRVSQISQSIAEYHRVSQISQDHGGHDKLKEKLEESEKELKHRLEKGQKHERKLETDLQELTNQIHQLDLEVVRLKMGNQQLTNDKSRLSHQLDELRESLKESKHSIFVLEKHKAELKKNCNTHNDRIREYERSLEKSDLDRGRLKGLLETNEELVQKHTKDRGKLLVYMKKRASHQEEQMRLLREQFRRRLAQAYKDRNADKALTFTTNSNEKLVTRLMEAEFKVYRRERLVEVLADRLRQYEDDFDVVTAPECAPYLDGDYKGTTRADLTRMNSDLTCTDDSESSTMTSDISY
ncbi:golgin subfamily A member 6C-like [Mizuhopecten yessoensis]|uniref:golgin subfamily A member 6C-like n=1 Tax=Mizuhopecten yessoensis TaxID=6573 RepID=UPI000B4583B8|nr:golgin subfamily A member 6C-like [Mizuhopecten yessoensis]